MGTLQRVKIELRYQARKRREKALMAIAWALPKSLAYWVAIRVISAATTGEYSNQIVPDLKALDVLERWPKTGATR